MLKSEFEERVKMPVQDWEFEAINVVYNNSDLNKDEFCKMWVSMNKSRVQQYKKAEAESNAAIKLLEAGQKIYGKLTVAWKKSVYTFCFDVLTRREGDILNQITNQEAYENMTAWDAAFEIGKGMKAIDKQYFGI